jgi:hypothetical protein
MTTLSRCVLCMAAVVLLAMASPQDNAESTAIVGTILDAATNKPVAGTTIRRLIDGPPGPSGFPRQIQAVSDSEGRFVLGTLDPGTLRVSFAKSGYVPRNFTYTLTRNQRFDAAVIRLSARGVLSGRVFDANGKPLVRAQVIPFSYRFSGGRRQLTANPGGYTNDRGEYRLIDLELGRYVIGIDSGDSTSRDYPPPPAPDFMNPSRPEGPILYPGVSSLKDATTVEVKSGEETRLRDITLTQIRLGPVRVQVANALDSTLKNISIRATNETRVYELSDIDAEYSIAFWGFSFDTSLRDRELQAREGFPLVYWPKSPGSYQLRFLATDSNGDQVLGFAKFDYTGEPINVTLPIPQPPAVRLNCRFSFPEGTPAEPANPVSMGFRNSEGRSVDCPELPAGFIDRNNTPASTPGLYNISHSSFYYPNWYIASARQGERDVLSEGVQMSAGTTTIDVVVVRNSGLVRGKVTDSQGKPAHNAVVAIIPERRSNSNPVSFASRFARADQDGTFEVRGITPGSYEIYAWFGVRREAALDPAFLGQYENRGRPLRVAEGLETVQNVVVLETP